MLDYDYISDYTVYYVMIRYSVLLLFGIFVAVAATAVVDVVS